MSDAQIEAGSRASQLIGRLGLYATYVAAALFTLALVGDLDVLVRRPAVVGGLALLVRMGPLAALLLSTLANYINFYGVWRIARGKDEFDAGQDLKSHAADLPVAAQALLARRGGCVPAASIALLCCSLVLTAVGTAPASTPFIGALSTGGTGGGGGGGTISTLGVPTATPTLDVPTATAVTATATATAPAQRPTATPTPASPVVAFSISPQQASWDCAHEGQLPAAQVLTLDNSRSSEAVHWSAIIVEHETGGNPWATVSANNGVDPAGSKQTITVTPDSAVCFSSSSNGTPWHVNITTDVAGTQTFTYTIDYYLT